VNGRDDPSTVGASAIPVAIARLARERDLEIALLVRAGSKAYGLELATSDDDYLGVFVPRLRELVSIPGLAAETHAGNEPDFTLHEIGKFCALALKGNPAILETLWNPCVLAETLWGGRLRALRGRCLHRGSLGVYVEYAEAQLRKMAKGQGLHAKGGSYNPKYGVHILRLLHAGLHLGREREVMVRVPPQLAATLMRVRKGELGAEDVVAMAGPLLAELRAAAAGSSLADAPDAAAFDDLVAAARLSRV
jgi:predicted nucleotidyltransferase